MPGNASKDEVAEYACLIAGEFRSPQKLFHKDAPQDMYDSFCIAVATRAALTIEAAA